MKKGETIKSLKTQIDDLKEQVSDQRILIEQLLRLHGAIHTFDEERKWLFPKLNVNNPLGRSYSGLDYVFLSRKDHLPVITETKAKTETAGDITFAELAQLVVDGKPIKREVKETTTKYAVGCGLSVKKEK